MPTTLTPGLQIDLLRDMLRAVLSAEDFAKKTKIYKTLSREQELANKVSDEEKLQEQVDNHRKMVFETGAKLVKHQTDVSDLCMHVNPLQLEIEALRAQVSAASLDSPVVPSLVCSGTPAYTPPGHFGCGKWTRKLIQLNLKLRA